MSESLQMRTCPKCGSPSTDLVDVDAGMRLILKSNGVTDLPPQVCSACYNELTSQVSQGVKLRLEQQAKEKNRHMVWKSRVNLVKHARQMMLQKAFPEAAVSYEKYIRVLEISYDLKPGELKPDVFGKTARSKELTVIATTYWDLLRIYDTSSQYRERMSKTAQKLAEFLPYSSIFPDVIKKAQAWAPTAKNPDIVREFLRLSKASTSRCFIATAAFEDTHHPVVCDLRQFRDHVLLRHPYGVKFVFWYYRVSPAIAQWLDHQAFARQLARIFLRLAAFTLKKY
jgi:hypothetical protein